MKRALERDDPEPLGPALDGVMLARGLDGAFDRFGAGIAEEHQVGEARRAQPLRETLALRDAEQIGDVPDFPCLLAQHLDKMRMRMAERAHCHAGGEIEIALAIGRDEPGAFAALEAEIDPGKDGKQMRRGAIGHGNH